MVPCEVPDTTGAHSEKVPLTTTRCLSYFYLSADQIYLCVVISFFFVVKVFQISFGAESISFVCIIFVQEKRNLTGVKALRLEKAEQHYLNL